MKNVISKTIIQQKIFLIRGQKVLLSPHLAELYGVQVKVLIQAVKPNGERFPKDFMFQLNSVESDNLKSQFVTSSWGGSRRSRPYAFTEQGVAMLSSVLNSPRAIQVNIQLMRAFVRIRQVIAAHKELAARLKELEGKVENHDEEIRAIFDAIRQLMAPPPEPRRRPIGFHVRESELKS